MRINLFIVVAIIVIAVFFRVSIFKKKVKRVSARSALTLKDRLSKLGDLNGKYKREMLKNLGYPESKFTTPDYTILRWKDEELEISMRFDRKGQFLEMTRMS